MKLINSKIQAMVSTQLWIKGVRRIYNSAVHCFGKVNMLGGHAKLVTPC